MKDSFDEILLQLTRVDLPAPTVFPRKILFQGERTGEISSYVAGWLARKGVDVIVLDGANRFNPYTVSTFAKKALIPPEKLLQKIQIARAFTCYQMAVLIGERLNVLLSEEESSARSQHRWIILLGPLTTFMDEDVSEREVRPLFERSLKKIEEMALRGVPFLFFQPSVFSDSKRDYLTRRLCQFSNEIWKISLEDQELKGVLEKGMSREENRPQISD